MFDARPPQDEPRSEDELRERASLIAGRTLGELAAAAGEDVPIDLTRDKGWAGRLIERWLGASAGNRPVPDFEQLGIELKTIPVDEEGRPLESTYVCMVPLTAVDEISWESSSVRRKLGCVLWVPILALRDIEILDRLVGQSILWTPDETEVEMLRSDWESHLHAIRQGAVDNIRGGDGEVLQIRPKAADSSQRTWSVDARGEAIMTMPRGFYLRALFTEYIVRRHFYHRTR